MNRLHSTSTHLQRSSGLQLISFLSGKGGVGKSILSFNFAERLAAIGMQVLLVDADFSTGNIHILANVPCERGIGHFLSGEMSLKEAVTPVTDNFDILGSTWQGSAPVQSDVSGAASMVERLREQASGYDVVLIDHSSGISEASTVIAHGSNINVLVMVPELTSISDCFGLVKTLVTANRNIDCRLLVNRTISAEETDQVQGKFLALTEQFLNFAPRFLGHINQNDLFRNSVAAQKPLSEVDSEGLVSGSLTDLSCQLLGVVAPTREGIDPQPTMEVNELEATADIRE